MRLTDFSQGGCSQGLLEWHRATFLYQLSLAQYQTRFTTQLENWRNNFQTAFFTHESCRLRSSTDMLQGLGRQSPLHRADSRDSAKPCALCGFASVVLTQPLVGLCT